MNTSALLDRLRAVRQGGPLIAQVPGVEQPRSLQEAYAIAEALSEPNAVVAGYKIGATSERGRQFLGLQAPFFGRIFKDSLHRSPATLRRNGRVLSLEAEIGCQIGVDLPPRGAPYSRGEVAASIRRALPLIEINCPSYTAAFEVGGLCLVADNGVNAGAVIGYPGSVSLDSIGASRVEVRVEGRAPVCGAVTPLPDDPLSSLTWLANALNDAGLQLRSGDIVATGAMTPPIDIDHESNVFADFGRLGAVQITVI